MLGYADGAASHFGKVNPIFNNAGIAFTGDGRVVNISSIFGLFSMPSPSAYNAAKFAVRGITESLRQEMLINNRPVSANFRHPRPQDRGALRVLIQTWLAQNA